MTKKISDLNLKEKIDKKEYKNELKKYQYQMLRAQQFLYHNKIGLIIVFEGMDAAGKGGAIKRLTQRLDPRGFQVHPISAPQPHEKRYHYMQRFWRRLPQHGQIGIFDRSWYGRVLVERIEEFATKDEWSRAYNEINSFEKTLTDENYIMIKFWIHIDKHEQLVRFNERQTNPYKLWKLTEEDWRNRDKFEQYVETAEDMFKRTDKEHAPWVLIPGNNKLYARIQVLKETIKQIEKEAGHRGLNITFEYKSQKDYSNEEELEGLLNKDSELVKNE